VCRAAGCLWCLLVLHMQSVRRNVNRNAGLICSHILSTRTMCFSRRVRLLLIVIAAGVSVSAETRKPIYRIRWYCKATSEYWPIRSIGHTLTITTTVIPLVADQVLNIPWSMNQDSHDRIQLYTAKANRNQQICKALTEIDECLDSLKHGQYTSKTDNWSLDVISKTQLN